MHVTMEISCPVADNALARSLAGSEVILLLRNRDINLRHGSRGE